MRRGWKTKRRRMVQANRVHPRLYRKRSANACRQRQGAEVKQTDANALNAGGLKKFPVPEVLRTLGVR
jgi:hypothetical protein